MAYLKQQFRYRMRRRPHVALFRLAFNVLYRFANRQERRNEVVFISRQRDVASYDFAVLADEFESRGWTTTMHLKKVTYRNLASYACYVLAEISLLGRCKAVVLERYDPVVSLIDFECDRSLAGDGDSAVNLDFPRRPVVLQLWHAFGAFKKFGFQSIGTAEGHAPDFMADWRIHRNYSWVVCSGEGCRAQFADAFSCPEERVIALNRPEYDELISLRAKASNVEDNDSERIARMRVLMAPTLRKDARSAHPLRSLYASREAFERGVDADFTWVFHPLEEGMPASGNVSDELLECDVVVTDYSSLVYEAYLLGKKVLFYIPDIEAFRLSPGLNRDPLKEAPALCARDEGELAEMLQTIVENPHSYVFYQLESFIGQSFSVPAHGSIAAGLADFVIEHSSC